MSRLPRALGVVAWRSLGGLGLSSPDFFGHPPALTGKCSRGKPPRFGLQIYEDESRVDQGDVGALCKNYSGQRAVRGDLCNLDVARGKYSRS